MTQVVTTEEPTVVREERVEHVHDDAPRSNSGVLLAVILLILILLALFWWRPWGGRSTGVGTNINVTAPRASTGR